MEHPNALEEWLGAIDWPILEIVTCEGDLGISTLTNRSGETTLAKIRRVDDGQEEEEVDQLEHEGEEEVTASNTT
jgi:hypothetical protein